MEYLIGIDGGGTKTSCVLTDLEGHILYSCKGGPSNFLMLGLDPVSLTILELIDNCLEHEGIDYKDIKAVLLGTTGAGRRTDAERLENNFNAYCRSKGIVINKFIVESDARIALEGAFSGRAGSILIAGTGSIMFGKDDEGEIHRVGGFGRFIGDEGSGYSVGKKGLIAASKSFDGRGEKTLISELISAAFNITSPEMLITEIYKNNFDIASVAPIVIEAASKKDKAAIKILDEETDELIIHLSAMHKKIGNETLDVSFVGGLICNENSYSKLFIKKIKKQLPYINVKEPDFAPEIGAVIMAKSSLQLS